MPGPLLLARSEIRSVIEWPVLFDAVREALLLREAGKVAAPVSGQVTMPNGLLHLKAGAIHEPGMISIKANLRPHGGNASGLVVLFDTDSGEVMAILDSADITAMRTAALAAVAAETLALPGEMALAVLGAGPVGRQVLAALQQRMPVRAVHLWSRDRNRAEGLARETALPVTIHDTPGAAARCAKLVVTATPSRTPFLEARDLTNGTLVLAMGADSPNKRELATSVTAVAAIIADQREDVLNVGESAYLKPEQAQSIVELGALLAGSASVPVIDCGRNKFVVFDSVGSAIVDATVSRSIVAFARARGLGGHFEFSQ